MPFDGLRGLRITLRYLEHMGRSVSSLSNATEHTYIHLDLQEDWEWDDFKDELSTLLLERMPSLDTCDKWDGREDHIMWENRLAEIAISEYCGLVCLSARPKGGDGYRGEPSEAMGAHWLAQVWPGLEKKLKEYYPENVLVRIGGMSNGESVYKQA